MSTPVTTFTSAVALRQTVLVADATDENRALVVSSLVELGITAHWNGTSDDAAEHLESARIHAEVVYASTGTSHGRSELVNTFRWLAVVDSARGFAELAASWTSSADELESGG